MNLTSGLPYASDVYWVLMQDYNARWLLATVLFHGSALGLVWAAFSVPALTRTQHRVIGVVLAFMAAWNGLMHQEALMADLNFMAPIYALGWGAFSVWLLLRWAVQTPRGEAKANWMRLDGACGVGLMMTALLVYPLLQVLSGVPAASAEYAGTSPNASALIIAGAVLAFTGRSRLDLLVFPMLWSGVAGLHGFLLHQFADYFVPFALALTVVCLVVAKLRPTRGAA